MAGVQLTHHPRIASRLVAEQEHPLPLAQSRLHRVGEARTEVGLEHQPVHHHLDAVLGLLVQCDRLLQPTDPAVDARPREPPLLRVLEQLPVLALPLLDQGSEQHQLGAPRHPENLVDDLLRRLPPHQAAAFPAVLHPDRGIQDAQVVVDLGHRPHRRPRVVARRLLLDGDGRREPSERLVLRLLHLPEELPCIRREALHVPSLSLGIEGVEGEGALSAPAHPAEDHQGLLRDVERDGLEVVLGGAPDGDDVGLGHAQPTLLTPGPSRGHGP